MLRRDLNIRSIRGNVDTRINKVERGEYDAIVLAAAGLRRLGWGDIISETFRPDIMCPAVGQGALAIETLEDRRGIRRLRAARRSLDAASGYRGAGDAVMNWAAAVRFRSARSEHSTTRSFSSPARCLLPMAAR